VYVTNDGGNSVSVINTANNTVTGTVTVGGTPKYLAIAPDGRKVYVVNSGGGTVSVIDTGTDTVVGTIPVGTDPRGIAILPDGTKAYVAHYTFTEVSALSVITLSNSSVMDINLGALSSELIPVAVADPTSKFAGRVTMAGAPLAGVLVRAMQGTWQKGFAISNSAGDYSVFNLPPGTYDINFDPPGCSTHNLPGQSVGGGRTTVLHSAFTAGECTFPEVQLSRESVSFGTQKLLTLSGTQSVTLTNNGGGNLHVSSFSIAGGNAGDFSHAHNCGTGDLTPGGHCSIAITFNPSDVGPRKSVLSLPSNAAGSPHEIVLTGVGTKASATPSPLNFSARQVSTTSPASAVTLTNTGVGAMRVWTTVVGGTNSADFARVSSCPIPPATLASPGTCTIDVTFTPRATGARSGQLQISHDGGASPLIVPLTGTGQGALAPSVAEKITKTVVKTATRAATETDSAGTSSSVVTPGSTVLAAVVSLSATTVKFGAQSVGTSDTPQGLVLKNSGNVPLMIGKVEIEGTSKEDFAQTNNCGSTLGAGQSCNLRITFTPQRRGARTAILNVVDSSNQGRHQVQLQGVGRKSHLAQRRK
jgi:YVTN family beta-propeller protein